MAPSLRAACCGHVVGGRRGVKGGREGRTEGDCCAAHSLEAAAAAAHEADQHG